jgi:nitrite reductase/ring-hydroxylating ferredoxin subunit
MAAGPRLICRSDQLAERGKGWRFRIDAADGGSLPAFAVRYRGKVYAYLNRCAHIGVEMDWAEGEFFDISGLYLVCATHGAAYHPESGRCASGPCRARHLQPLAVSEVNGAVYLLEKEKHD